MEHISKNKVKLSLVIPSYNEESCVEETIIAFNTKLIQERIPHEILVINDHSLDKTEAILIKLSKKIKELRYINNNYPKGFGFAVKKGLENFSGDCVAIIMADLSDNPSDLIRYYKKCLDGHDCVFGSRFIRGGRVIEYPLHKLVLNRIGNIFIKYLFQINYNDTTNSFKLYRKEVISGVMPLKSQDYNLTVELPLKAIIRKYSYVIIPNSWVNRNQRLSNFKIKEMGSKYLSTIFSCWKEKRLRNRLK